MHLHGKLYIGLMVCRWQKCLFTSTIMNNDEFWTLTYFLHLFNIFISFTHILLYLSLLSFLFLYFTKCRITFGRKKSFFFMNAGTDKMENVTKYLIFIILQ